MTPKYTPRPTTDWWPNWSTAPLDYNDTFWDSPLLSSTMPYPNENTTLIMVLECKNRHLKRKDSALKREKPRPSKRRHKFSK